MTRGRSKQRGHSFRNVDDDYVARSKEVIRQTRRLSSSTTSTTSKYYQQNDRITNNSSRHNDSSVIEERSREWEESWSKFHTNNNDDGDKDVDDGHFHKSCHFDIHRRRSKSRSKSRSRSTSKSQSNHRRLQVRSSRTVASIESMTVESRGSSRSRSGRSRSSSRSGSSSISGGRSSKDINYYDGGGQEDPRRRGCFTSATMMSTVNTEFDKGSPSRSNEGERGGEEDLFTQKSSNTAYSNKNRIKNERKNSRVSTGFSKHLPLHEQDMEEDEVDRFEMEIDGDRNSWNASSRSSSLNIPTSEIAKKSSTEHRINRNSSSPSSSMRRRSSEQRQQKNYQPSHSQERQKRQPLQNVMNTTSSSIGSSPDLSTPSTFSDRYAVGGGGNSNSNLIQPTYSNSITNTTHTATSSFIDHHNHDNNKNINNSNIVKPHVYSSKTKLSSLPKTPVRSNNSSNSKNMMTGKTPFITNTQNPIISDATSSSASAVSPPLVSSPSSSLMSKARAWNKKLPNVARLNSLDSQPQNLNTSITTANKRLDHPENDRNDHHGSNYSDQGNRSKRESDGCDPGGIVEDENNDHLDGLNTTANSCNSAQDSYYEPNQFRTVSIKPFSVERSVKTTNTTASSGEGGMKTLFPGYNSSGVIGEGGDDFSIGDGHQEDADGNELVSKKKTTSGGAIRLDVDANMLSEQHRFFNNEEKKRLLSTKDSRSTDVEELKEMDDSDDIDFIAKRGGITFLSTISSSSPVGMEAMEGKRRLGTHYNPNTLSSMLIGDEQLKSRNSSYNDDATNTTNTTAEIAECVADVLEQDVNSITSSKRFGKKTDIVDDHDQLYFNNSKPSTIGVSSGPISGYQKDYGDNDKADFLSTISTPSPIMKQMEAIRPSPVITGAENSIRRTNSRDNSLVSSDSTTGTDTTVEIAECVADVLDQSLQGDSNDGNNTCNLPTSGDDATYDDGDSDKRNDSEQAWEVPNFPSRMNNTESTKGAKGFRNRNEQKDRVKRMLKLMGPPPPPPGGIGTTNGMTEAHNSVTTTDYGYISASSSSCSGSGNISGRQSCSSSSASSSSRDKFKDGQFEAATLSASGINSSDKESNAYLYMQFNSSSSNTSEESHRSKKQQQFSQFQTSDAVMLKSQQDIYQMNEVAAKQVSNCDYEAALCTFQDLIETQIAIHGEDHPLVAATYHNMGIVQVKQASMVSEEVEREYYHGNALKSFRKASSVARESLGENHPNVAVSLVRIGFLLLTSNHYYNALVTFREALRIRKVAFGKEHSLVAKVYNNLGVSHLHLGNYQEGLLAFERALDIQRSVLGKLYSENNGEDVGDKKHEESVGCLKLEVADSLCNIGSLCLDWVGKRQYNDSHQTLMRLMDQAESSFSEAMTIRTMELGADHGQTILAQSLYESARNIKILAKEQISGLPPAGMINIREPKRNNLSPNKTDASIPTTHMNRTGLSGESEQVGQIPSSNVGATGRNSSAQTKTKKLNWERDSVRNSEPHVLPYDDGIGNRRANSSNENEHKNTLIGGQTSVWVSPHVIPRHTTIPPQKENPVIYSPSTDSFGFNIHTDQVESSSPHSQKSNKNSFVLSNNAPSNSDKVHAYDDEESCLVSMSDGKVSKPSIRNSNIPNSEFQQQSQREIMVVRPLESNASNPSSPFAPLKNPISYGAEPVQVRTPRGIAKTDAEDSPCMLLGEENSVYNKTPPHKNFEHGTKKAQLSRKEDHSTKRIYSEEEDGLVLPGNGTKSHSVNDSAQNFLEDKEMMLHPEKYVIEIHESAAKHLKNSNFNKSLELFEVLLETHRNIYGELHHTVGSTLHNIGIVHLRAENYEHALNAFNRAVRVRKGAIGRDHADVAISLVKVGIVQLLLHQFDQALFSFRDALSIRRHALGHIHPSTARVYNNIGCVHVEFNEMREARRAFEAALDVQRNALCHEPESGPLMFGAATTLCNLGYLYTYRDMHEKASMVLEEAVVLQQQVLGEHHPTVLSTLDSLADSYRKSNDCAGALRTYKEIMKRFKNRDGNLKRQDLPLRKQRALALVLYKISRIHRKQNDNEAALQRLKESLFHVRALGDSGLLNKVQAEVQHVESILQKNKMDWI